MTNLLSTLAILIGGGSLVGLLSGLFGIGGALIIVPLLNILFSHMGMGSLDLTVGELVYRRAVEKQIARLKADGILERIGPDKGGRWRIRQRGSLGGKVQ